MITKALWQQMDFSVLVDISFVLHSYPRGVGVEERGNLMQWGVTLSKNMDLIKAKVLWG